MKYANLGDITFGQIQAFVSVAELRGFTAASEFLHISQPVVSKRVSALENTIGIPLFIRSHSNLKLTPSGTILYNSWRKLFDNMVESINTASLMFEGHSKVLRIAYCATNILKGCCDSFRKLHPNVELYFTKLQYPEMKTELLSGNIDIMLYGSFSEPDFDENHFAHKRLFSNSLSVCCSPEHPFAVRDQIDISELKTQQFIMLSPSISPMWLTMVASMCLKENFYPKVSMYVNDVSSLCMNTFGTDRIFIADNNVEFTSFGLATIPLKGYTSGLTATWLRSNKEVLIPNFIEHAVEYFKESN